MSVFFWAFTVSYPKYVFLSLLVVLLISIVNSREKKNYSLYIFQILLMFTASTWTKRFLRISSNRVSIH